MTDGVIYLLHFDRAHHHARHYLGWCHSYEGLDSRFTYHANGHGSRLLGAVSSNGNGWRLARLWKGTRSDERRLKNWKNTPQLCPVCRDGHALTPAGLEELPI